MQPIQIEVDRALRAPEDLTRSLGDAIQRFEQEVDAVLADERWNAYSDPVLRDYDRAMAVEAAARKHLGAAWQAYQQGRLSALAVLDAAATEANDAYTRATDPRKYQGLDTLRADLRARIATRRHAEDIAADVAEFARRSPAHAAAAWLSAGEILAAADAVLPQHRGDAARVKALVERAVEQAREAAYPGAGEHAARRDAYRRAIQSLATDAHVRRTLYWARRRRLAAVVGTPAGVARYSIRPGARVTVRDWGTEWAWSPDSWLRRRPEDEIQVVQGGGHRGEPLVVGRPEVRR